MTMSSLSAIMDDNAQRLNSIKDMRNTKISTTPRNLAFMGMTVGSVLFLGMFALQIISGLVAGLFTIAVAVGGWYGIRALRQFDPMIRQKMRNKQIEMMIKEAQERSIEQLTNQVLENQANLKKARDTRDKMGAQVARLKSMLDKDTPGSATYDNKKKIFDKVNTAYEGIIANVEKAARQNAQFEKKVEEHREMHRFASEAGSILDLMSASADGKLNDILSLEAFASIEDEFNTTLIGIENTSRDMLVDSEA